MPNYIVTRAATGQVVKHGDTVTSFRGEPGVFQGVTRGPAYNGTAKVLVGGREYYERVWGLQVVELETVLAAVKDLLPEIHENYLNGEGDDRERLHGLRFDLDHTVNLANAACDYDMADNAHDLLLAVDNYLALA